MSIDPDLVGETISHYEVVEKLGQGGMGIVYKALDTQLGRSVALKFLPPSAGDDALGRFRREAQAASSLNHPNILTVYEFGQDGDRRFIVMECVDGVSLRDRLTDQSIPQSEALGIARQIASGLAAAHDAGIIHRDIKPENVMIRRDGLVKILDFGLAKLTETASTDSVDTREDSGVITGGAIVGTLPYMAPEHLRGQPVDARTDLFATGVVLFEMLAGQRPFRSEVATMISDAILHAQPALPSVIKPEIPPAVDRVVLKCLDKEPGNRYQTAREFSADLDRLASGTTPLAPAITSPGDRFRRRAAVAAVAAIALVAIGAALDVNGWRTRMLGGGAASSHVESLAVLPFENLSADAGPDYFADGMTDELISRLSKVGALRVISRTSAMRYKKSGKSLKDIARELDVDAVVEGTVLRSNGRVRINVVLISTPGERQLWSERYERDLQDVLALQSDLASAIVREIRIKVDPDERTRLAHTRTVTPEAYELFLRGRALFNLLTPEALKESEQYFQQAIEKDTGYAPAYAGLADSLAQQAGRSRPPVETQPPARIAALRAIELDDTLGDGHASLGQVKLFYDFDWPGAGHEFETAARLNAGSPIVHQFYGLYLASAGRVDEALKESSRAVELDPLSASAGCIHARLLYYARRYDEAVAQFTKTLAFAPNTAGSCAWLGYTYLQMSRLPEAVAAAAQASAASPNEAQGPAVLTRAYGLMGKKAESSAVLQQLLEKRTRQFVSPYNVGVAYIGTDDEKAIDLFEEAYAERAGILCFLSVDPAFDPLRSNARFQALVRKIGIPPPP